MFPQPPSPMPLLAPIPAPPASSDAVRRSMLGNRRVDTKPEVQLRSLLHRAGLRFRKDRLIRLGARRVRPDVVFGRQRVAVFMDGCFWHRCPEHGTMPSTNHAYWLAKFQTNIARDERNNAALMDEGWRVIRIWEHEVLDADLAQHAVSRVVSAVRGHDASSATDAMRPDVRRVDLAPTDMKQEIVGYAA